MGRFLLLILGFLIPAEGLAQGDPSAPLVEVRMLTQEALDLVDVSTVEASSKASEALNLIREIRENGFISLDNLRPLPREEVMGYEMEAYYVMVRFYMERQDYKEAERFANKGLRLADALNEPEFYNSFSKSLRDVEYNLASKKKGLGKLFYSVDRGIRKTIVPEVNKVGGDVNRQLMVNAENKARERMRNNDLIEAGRYYLEASRYADKLNDTILFLEFQNKVISLYMELGQYEEALEMAEGDSRGRIASIEGMERMQGEEGRRSGEMSKPSIVVIEKPTAPSLLSPAQKETIRSSVERENNRLIGSGSNASRPSLAQQLARMEASLKRKLEDSLKAAEFIQRNEQEIERLTLDSKYKQLKLEEQEFDLKRRKRELGYFVVGLAAIVSLALLLYILFFYQKRVNKKLQNAYEQLKSAQLQLVESEKMASLGQLTAGVAHEINNPVNFISGNVLPLRRDMEDVFSILDSYENQVEKQGLNTSFSSVEQEKRELDIQFVKEEIHQLLEGIEEGAFRTAEIVKELRNFARMDELSPKSVDIHQGLDSTLALLRHKTQDLELVKSYGEIPFLVGLPGKLNQVFMNLLTNAIQSGASQVQLQTRVKKIDGTSDDQAQDLIEVMIEDNGKGIPKEVLPRIFDPFYTTKDVGEGTGLGLSISKGIIEQHGGSIQVQSTEGEGTKVTIGLPVKDPGTETH